MSVKSVATSINDVLKPFYGNFDNNAISRLEKQKMQLEEQIEKIKKSDIADQIKQDRVEQLEERIQEIEIEIQNKQREKLNQKKNTNQQKHSEQSIISTQGDDGLSRDMSGLLGASITNSKLKTMNNTKNSLNRKGDVLEAEIKLDESRGGEAKAKKAELQDIESRKQILNKKIGDTFQEGQSQLEEVSKQEIKNSDKNNKNELISDQQGIEDRDIVYKKIDIKV
ncbi:hypothetical protein GM661_12650 [Iocasia frigidifontis]|uniref:Uncharacterized protein n=1 Tax=Iocasia fonsfrigidae TaxID=2682810 RepID=A0A8A7KAC0_9FIRM|nr:FlxA-like family protein [Iocasia fonsfrigidae]QTL98753.1 hypothetical protein GM661_12650 [Iocasia fonsfrigidae]